MQTPQTKSFKKLPGLEVVEVFLVECNLVDNQYQQNTSKKSFTPKKSYVYFLNVEPSNSVFWKFITQSLITDQNGRPL